MISQSGLYAIRAAAALARIPLGRRADARQVARAAGVPVSYVPKVLQALGQAGIVSSRKGPGGGFHLARPAAEITLWDVLERVDDPARRTGCLLGQARCSDDAPCALHRQWKSVRGDYCDLLRRTTLADMATSAANEPAESFLSTEMRRLRGRSTVNV